MRMIVGLGNPGARYEWTRHNCGFLVVDELARRSGVELRTKQCQALTARARIAGQEILLVKPQTYMNLSGVAVAQLKEKYEVARTDEILVISDELALPFGRIRLRRGGSAGGHNGLKSIIARLGSEDFPRLRIGIAPEHPISDAAAFVLAEFSREQRAALDEIIGRAADAAEVLCQEGIEKAMSRFN